MKHSVLNSILRTLNIPKYIDENFKLPQIIKELKTQFEENNWDTKPLSRYALESFIKTELSLVINPNKEERISTYWIPCEKLKKDDFPGQMKMDIFPSEKELQSTYDKTTEPSPLNEIDLINKQPTKIEEPSHETPDISLESIDNDVKTLLKNMDYLKSEIKRIKRLNNIGTSNKNKEQNRLYIEEMIKILGRNNTTESVSINSTLLENIKDLISEEYGIKKDISKIINAALILALYNK